LCEVVAQRGITVGEIEEEPTNFALVGFDESPERTPVIAQRALSKEFYFVKFT
jgi:hypothetical protein